ncbi:MAG: glycosyltransferase family 2 protein [Thermoplasmata archaeon]
MLYWVVVVLLVVGGILVLLLQGYPILLAYQMPRLDPAPAVNDRPDRPKVSVILAARNEALDLPAALDSLAAQDYPNLEVVVVDGGSTDGTRSVAERRAPAVRCVDEPPLPDGWVGKSWACWTGARASDGSWLLFMDADVRLSPSTIRTTVDWADREGASVVTIVPRIEMVGFWERVVLPFYAQIVLTVFRAPDTNRDGASGALVNGQYWMARRTVYSGVGGHEAVRGQVLEDVAIAQRFRASGEPIRISWAPGLASTRMYRDRHEMFEGILKNIHGIEFAASRQAAFLGALIGLYWLPLGLLPLGIVVGSLPLAGLGAILWVALFGKHVAFARTTGAPAVYGLLYPVAVGFYVAVVIASLVRGVRGRGVTWKGRTYAVRP